MFKKMKLRPYLITVFAIIVVLATIITVFGIVGLIQTKNKMTLFINETLKADTAIKVCRLEANVAARDMRDMVFTTDKSIIAQRKQRINEAMQSVGQQMEIFRATHGEEDGLADKYDTILRQWYSVVERVIAAAEEGDQQKAGIMVLNEAAPLFSDLADVAKEIDAVTNVLVEERTREGEGTVNAFIILMISVYIVAFIITVWLIMVSTGSIVGAVDKMKEAVAELTKGKLSTHVDYVAKNEFGELTDQMNFAFSELSKYVKSISGLMVGYADGNFTVDCDVDFLGDFVVLGESMNTFSKDINKTLSEVTAVSEKVGAGSEQVATGSQSLAQGATEQASSVEELSATIADISENIAHNANNAEQANILGKETGEVLENSVSEMKQMLQAIQDISTSSESIGKIIKVIDDIAFQTNILALNAAVEAARAGDAGKGFAVVADEVRNLAGKSSEAAKNTTALIEGSLEAVKRGINIANATNDAFAAVTEKSLQVLKLVDEIASASKEQAISAKQISQGIEQISSVIQMNSATSEESAAASAELSGEAEKLTKILSGFKIKDAKGESTINFPGMGEEIDTVSTVSYMSEGGDKY